jgi:uncharacterized protein (DUF58 family)
VTLVTAVRDWYRARRPLWSVFPTRRSAAVVALAALAWLVPGSIGVSIGASLLAAVVALLVFDYVRLPRRHDVTARRRAPESIGLGDAAEVRYEIVSRWPWPIRATLFQSLPPALSADRAPIDLRFAAAGDRPIVVPVEARARGRHSLGDSALRLTTPLGMLARFVRVPLDDEVLIVPSLTHVRHLRLLAMQHRLTDAGIRALRLRGEGQAFVGLREYAPGDDPRFVDWKATARHQRLITREHTIERSQTVMILVDCGRVMTQLAGTFSRLEHVLSAAIVLTDVAATSGDQVGLLAFDDELRAFVPAQRGRAALRNVRSALSGLEATLTEPDYSAAFRMLALRQRKRALVVFFTDVIDARVARSLVAHVSRSAQRHLVVVVAIQNDELLEAARPKATGALALYRSAAAEELIHEREEALTRMRRAGVAVLDVAPTQMATAVVNRYTEVKARGLL